MGYSNLKDILTEESSLDAVEKENDVVTDNVTTSFSYNDVKNDNTVNDIDVGENYIDITLDNMRDYLEEAPVYSAMMKDLYIKSIKDYFGYLTRLDIMGIIIIGLIFWMFKTKMIAAKSILLLMSVILIMIGTTPSFVIKYSIKNILWYKKLSKSVADHIYMGVVTNKINIPKSNKRYAVIDNKYHLNIDDFSEYSEINIKGVAIVIVKDNEFHVIGAEEFLGIKSEKISLKEFMK